MDWTHPSVINDDKVNLMWDKIKQFEEEKYGESEDEEKMEKVNKNEDESQPTRTIDASRLTIIYRFKNETDEEPEWDDDHDDEEHEEHEDDDDRRILKGRKKSSRATRLRPSSRKRTSRSSSKDKK